MQGYQWTAPIASVTKPRGNTAYTQVYADVMLNGESAPRVISQTDAYGNTTQLGYSAKANEVTETRPDATTVVYGHENGVPSGYRDSAGHSAAFSQSIHEQITSMTDREGDITNLTYHADTGRLATYQDAEGSATSRAYTAQVQTFTNPANQETVEFTFYDLASIIHPDTTTTNFTCDARGNVLTSTDRGGETTTFTYSTQGLVLTAENPTGGTVTYTYNADGTLATRQDPETGTTAYAYDAAKRLVTVTYPDGATRQFDYNENDQITSMTDELGRVTQYAYDDNGNPSVTTDAYGSTITYTYDDMDRQVELTDREGKVTTFAFDATDRLGSITDPNALTVSYGYDVNGWRTGATLGGRTWTTAYDKESVPTSSTTPSGFATSYTTDKMGHVTEASDPLSNRTQITRDSMRRVTQIIDPASTTNTFAYDDRGGLAGVTKSAIGSVAYTRNGLGRVSGISDLNGKNWTFTYSNMGRLTEYTDPLANVWGRTYDNRGRVNVTTRPDASTETRTYDAAGNLTTLAPSDGPTLNYTYDASNRLLTADGIGFTYDAEGRITSTANPGAVATGAAYDDGGRLNTVTYPHSGGVFTVTYSYDGTTGLLSRVTDDLTGAWVDLIYDDDHRLTAINRKNGENTSFGWDDASRLTRIRHGDSADIQYTLDGAGRITDVDMTVPNEPEPLLVEDAQAYTYDAASQVSTAGYVYDTRGNCTADPHRNFTRDGAGRVTSAGGAALVYNGLNDLTSRTTGKATTIYYYNWAIGLHPIVSEKISGGAWQKHYVYTPGGQLLYMIDEADSNEAYYYHFDHVGSTLFLTNSAGTITDSYAYDPYGKLLGHEGSNGQSFTFVGQWGVRQEGTSGTLYQMRARYYDAQTGAFLSRDSVWPVLDDPQSLNPYQYAAQNPLLYIDPEGEAIISVPTAVTVFAFFVLREIYQDIIVDWIYPERNLGGPSSVMHPVTKKGKKRWLEEQSAAIDGSFDADHRQAMEEVGSGKTLSTHYLIDNGPLGSPWYQNYKRSKRQIPGGGKPPFDEDLRKEIEEDIEEYKEPEEDDTYVTSPTAGYYWGP